MGRRRYRNFRQEKRIRIVFKVVSLLLVFLIFLVLFDAKARPIVKTVAVNRAQNVATNIISDAVGSYLSDEKTSYSDLSEFVFDSENKICAVNINLENANKLESKVSDRIAQELEKAERTKFSIPVGSIIGGNFLSGRGPKISFWMSLAGRCNSSVMSEFSEAGINQTRHRVLLQIKTDVHIIMNGNNTSTVVENSFIIAETVLLGGVPLAFSS
ncbi:MAG: sporulation protein YunB [Clostridia bacterium]|nr:sporulation protein YunB [Clostridia bacterium]